MILGGVLWLLGLGNVTPNIIQHMIENKEMNRDSLTSLTVIQSINVKKISVLVENIFY